MKVLFIGGYKFKQNEFAKLVRFVPERSRSAERSNRYTELITVKNALKNI